MSRALTDDTLITLQQAVDYAFVDKACSVATLKAEAAKGNLDISKIGRSYFTTLAKIKAMEAKCLVDLPAPSSGSTKPAKAGRSSTDASAAAQASVQMKLQERKKRLGITSRRNTQ